MGRRDKVFQGRFGSRSRRACDLPPELVNLRYLERKKWRWQRYLPLWGVAVAVGLLVGIVPSVWNQPTTPVPSPERPRTNFGFCHTGAGFNCVVDGDTIWIDGQKVRVADIDAPETHDFRCPEEKALGDRATQRLLQLVNGGPVTLQAIDRDEDAYGRKLRVVMVNGTSVGTTLVNEGLARSYDGGRKPWC